MKSGYFETLLNLNLKSETVCVYPQSNRITKIEGLQSLVNLRELYLSHNGIEVIEGLENNVSYRKYNRPFLKGLEAMPNIRPCACSAKHVTTKSDLPKNCCLPLQKKLTTLDIAANRVKKIENISHLTELQEFWVWISVRFME